MLGHRLADLLPLVEGIIGFCQGDFQVVVAQKPHLLAETGDSGLRYAAALRQRVDGQVLHFCGIREDISGQLLFGAGKRAVAFCQGIEEGSGHICSLLII